MIIFTAKALENVISFCANLELRHDPLSLTIITIFIKSQ